MSVKGGDLNPSLNFFSVPPTDVSTSSSRWIKISPTTNSVTPIQFYLDKQADLIDLSRSYFEFDLGFQTTGNGNITASKNDDNDATMTGFANNMPHTLIKQLIVKCNGTLLTEQVDMYHHKAYIQTLLNYNREDGETVLKATNGLWRNIIDNPATYSATKVTGPDAAGANAHNDYKALSANHKASILAQKKETRELWSGGKRQILRMRPYVEIFHQNRWIVPNTSFEFQIWLNPPDVFTNLEASPGGEPVRSLTADDIKVSFYMCLVKLNPTVYMNMMKTLNTNMALYPMVRSEIRQYPLDNAATYKEILNPFSNRVPQRFVVAILNNTAFNGSVTKDTFAYQSAGVEYIKQMVDGEEYPYETLELNTANGRKDERGYWRFLEATGCLERNNGNMVRFADWGYGKNATLYVFSNIANGRQDAPVLLPTPQAHIDLHIKCASQPNQRTIIILAEYEAVAKIHSPKSATYMSVQ